MNIKIEQNMSVSDLPEMCNLDLKKVDLFDKNEKPWSKYAINVDDECLCIGVTDSLVFKLMFLITQESYMDAERRAQGHLFLNEAYDILRARRTKDGQMMGWIFDKKRKEDNSVEFTVYIDQENVMVDFNIDGNILDIFEEIS